MKTNQLMKREFMDSQITQRTKDSFFNATELLAVYNNSSISQKRFKDFWENKNTQQFIDELQNELSLNGGNSAHLKTHNTTRGKGGGTWMHPYLFVKFAMWLSPKFELQIIKWVYDNLIETRNQAGDFYKEMTDTIMSEYMRIKGQKPNPFIYVNEAKFLNQLCYGTDEINKRNQLSEIELRLLNDLQRLNIKLIKNVNVSNQERREQLVQYAHNYKLINY